MSAVYRLAQCTLLALLGAQILAVSVYGFWFFPTFADGIGPEDETTSGSANRTGAASIGLGGVIVLLDVLAWRGILRSMRHGAPPARPLLAAGAAQVLVAACALLVGWLSAAAAAVFVLLLALGCQLAGRPRAA
ncbi:hypothetical protein [Streptomyces zagrosensis]|uniref:Integral membrane protein n=1 Tax=Streptomyces zagrosensis TaxID=1042984 RepID=A0A7W9Q8P9_9ACTN|nr:hypothetical protein [Streptomyces zagrosensis]MBB5935690.1 hypothetical protein [Streptomyces zagrosensis]